MIYFCIPAHNEERTVGVVLWKLRQVMAELGRDYQIIVVDDASTDSTPAVLSPYIRVLPLTVIRNAQRRGYADSLELAVREAVRRSPYPKRDSVITLQADFTEDPDVVPTLVKRIEAGADVVTTSLAFEPETPRQVRWGHRLMRWLLRKYEWASLGDPLSGLRAYRIVALKRAIEARGTGRIMTWGGMAANAELLSLAIPNSRRSEVVETTLLQHRLQRASRYAFMPALRAVRGVASGKPNSAAQPLPLDSVVATPLPLAVEPVVPDRGRDRYRGTKRPERGARPGARPRSDRTESGERAERPARPERGGRGRGEKPAQRKRPDKPVVEATVTPQPEGAAVTPAKKRRRSRKRKEKRPQADAPVLVVEQTETVATTSNGSEELVSGTPKKKSRRGRRGGRGRRRGGRTSGDNSETQNSGGADAPPPIAAEGD